MVAGRLVGETLRTMAEATRPGVSTAEPHVALGGGRIYQSGDGWTLKIRDGGPVASFEHRIVATSGAPIIVTTV